MRPGHICAALMVIASACGASAPTTRATKLAVTEPSSTPTSTTAISTPTVVAKDVVTVGTSDFSSPPSIRVRGGGRELALKPTSYCWSDAGKGVCADGMPSDSPPDIGSPAEIEVGFDARNWHFVATAVLAGQRCGRAQTVTLEPIGPTSYRLAPIGVAGDYVVSLFGRGAREAGQGGDVSASFRWHTPLDGPNVAPVATASIVAGRPPDLRSFGVEMSMKYLRRSPGPGNISASAVVTSSDGASMAIDLERKVVDCSPEGSVSFTAAKELGEQAAKLGSAPFRYDVTRGDRLGDVSRHGLLARRRRLGVLSVHEAPIQPVPAWAVGPAAAQGRPVTEPAQGVGPPLPVGLAAHLTAVHAERSGKGRA